MTKQRSNEMSDDNGKRSNEKNAHALPEYVCNRLEPKSSSEPTSRKCSFRKCRQRSESSIFRNVIRRDSFPRPAEKLFRSSSDLPSEVKGQFTRVRSFKMTPSGILNGSMPYNRRTSSISSTCHRSRLASDTSDDSTIAWSCSSSCSTGYYRVPIMGANGVGKSALETRFMNSEYMSSFDFGIDDFDDKTLSVVVDNEESTLEFVDYVDNEEDIVSFPADAYIVVFSVHDHVSFVVASQYLQYLRNELDSDRPIVLVANKVDLVRKRQISADVARRLAKEYDCKYIETSAVLNHKVDELLVGILKQIKLKLNPEAIEKAAILSQNRSNKQNKQSTCKGPKRFLNKLFRRSSKSISNCDNLLDL